MTVALSGIPLIETERLVLRTPTLADVKAIANIANANFGRSLTAQDSRQLQFAVKLVF